MKINFKKFSIDVLLFLAYFRLSSVDGHELVSHSGGGSVQCFLVLLIKAGFNQDI